MMTSGRLATPSTTTTTTPPSFLPLPKPAEPPRPEPPRAPVEDAAAAEEAPAHDPFFRAIQAAAPTDASSDRAAAAPRAPLLDLGDAEPPARGSSEGPPSAMAASGAAPGDETCAPPGSGAAPGGALADACDDDVGFDAGPDDVASRDELDVASPSSSGRNPFEDEVFVDDAVANDAAAAASDVDAAAFLEKQLADDLLLAAELQRIEDGDALLARQLHDDEAAAAAAAAFLRDEESAAAAAALENEEAAAAFFEDEERAAAVAFLDEEAAGREAADRVAPAYEGAPAFELPLSLFVSVELCRVRVSSTRRWCEALRADAKWADVSELAANVLFGLGLNARPLEEALTEVGAANNLPALFAQGFDRGQDSKVASGLGLSAKAAPRLLVASGASASKRRLFVAAVVLDPGDEDAGANPAALEALHAALSDAGFFVRQGDSSKEVDSTFVADLQRAFAVELAENLRTYSKPLDDLARAEELRTAQLMALVAPAYAAAGVQAPRPTRSTPLAHFPLVGARSPLISEFPAGAESAARNLVAAAGKARRAAEGDEAAVSDEAVVSQPVVSELCSELRTWCALEASAMTRRKATAVSARLRNVDAHAAALLSTLAESPIRQPSPAEARLWALFRVAATGRDAVFYECGAAVGGRPGRLSVAASACYWHSPGLLGGAQLVFPYFSLSSVEAAPLSGGPALSVSERMRAAAQNVADAALGLADEKMSRVTLVDASGASTDFIVLPSAAVPRHADRVADVLRLALRGDAQRRADGALRAPVGAPPTPPHARKQPSDEIEILERVQRIAAMAQRHANLDGAAPRPPPPPPPLAPAAGAPRPPPPEYVEAQSRPMSNLEAFLASAQKTQK
ncbi:hypothetical protein M885DRAFT_277896 [Pelagophyceae sp. CCMP2097]|nr:hypothetical protein M885DRAFT_277896 [Pelagophyceae sp. CCMP2097]